MIRPSASRASASPHAGLGVDEYFTRTDSTGTSDFLSNALGSTIALADTTGTVQTQYTYSPFGGTTVQGAANASSFQFTGRENDGQGLYYYRARYYDPMLARFVSQDPVSMAGGGPNFYAYVLNGPVAYRDPSGKGPVTAFVGLGLGIVYGGVGGLVGGGGWRGALTGAAVGGAIGFGVGLFDPSFGLLTKTVVGGLAAGAGDYIGQRFAGAGGSCHPINWGSVGGAFAGGLVGGGVGGYIGAGIEATGGAVWASALAGGTVENNFGLFGAGIGGTLGVPSLAGRNCGCR